MSTENKSLKKILITSGCSFTDPTDLGHEKFTYEIIIPYIEEKNLIDK